MSEQQILSVLLRIADALERQSPKPVANNDLDHADAFVWHPETCALHAIHQVNHVPLDMLQGIELQKKTLNSITSTQGVYTPTDNQNDYWTMEVNKQQESLDWLIK